MNFLRCTNHQGVLRRFYYGQTCVEKYDLLVIGGGIVGAASAREILQRRPNLKVGLVEKEERVAQHQSGHNSGVIHAGIYYKPGTLKARLCVEGLKMSYDYFDRRNIPYKKCGKLIVATDESQLKSLDDLYARGMANGVPDLQMVDGDKIAEIEPYCQGVRAIWSPHTGIVDWQYVTECYVEDFVGFGGMVFTNFNVVKIEESPDDPEYPINVHSKSIKRIRTKYVLTCGGLHSDKLAEMTGGSRSPRIVPFRGEYLLLRPEKCNLVRGNIYPVPDPRLPFLGVHFTPRMDGSVWLGPNAVLAFKREGYTWGDVNPLDLLDALMYPGFRKLATKYMSSGVQEMMRSIFIGMQVRELQKFIPEVTEFDIERGPAGVRAQALDPDGNLVDDFVFERGSGKSAVAQRVLHCRNAPSPGATSSLAIGKVIADKLAEEFKL
ncbi:L-2-hydroxyglutarate dehydrogenase, mitochondrial [Lutzomyia longipalpis]|uniref:L-2-hydroxyglutarate dehydrogenase, mitochondrial n=1 Tax=Lutzomyia longipalpis TaxID=7200 RepID=UPI0024837B2B|nr:L-2-hydroxyglutarate dehydrogenase, mitochondrial [Lutzomyia longipalpis]XP_055690710.1 L-2-hydroxyglutarate dehydrogenase, mitochondrial [Lutzomyia longipalpis]